MCVVLEHLYDVHMQSVVLASSRGGRTTVGRFTTIGSRTVVNNAEIGNEVEIGHKCVIGDVRSTCTHIRRSVAHIH